MGSRSLAASPFGTSAFFGSDQIKVIKAGKGKAAKIATFLPDTYALAQNAPNPFNPNTQVVFQIPEPGEVALVVFNLLGHPIVTLVRDYLEAGYYQVEWDGTDGAGRAVSSGIYFLPLHQRGPGPDERMLLVR